MCLYANIKKAARTIRTASNFWSRALFSFHSAAQYNPGAKSLNFAPRRDAGGGSTFHLFTRSEGIPFPPPSPVHPPESARITHTTHHRVWKHRRAKINSTRARDEPSRDSAPSVLNKLAKCRQGLWAPARSCRITCVRRVLPGRAGVMSINLNRRLAAHLSSPLRQVVSPLSSRPPAD